MDPATLISFSSVFGLMATFLQERRGREEAQTQATLQEYIEWLRRRDHAEVVTMLGSNHQLSQAIQHLLMTGHDELLERFDRLETMLTLVLGTTAEWGELVRSIHPHAGLSDQAIEILRWFDGTGASRVIEFRSMGGVVALIPPKGGGNFSPKDERFFTDDMETLVGLGLLIPDFGSRGSRNYTITRAAVKLVKSLPQATDDS